MESKPIFFGLKLFALTSIFFILINYFGSFLNAQNFPVLNKFSSNEEQFTSSEIQVVGSVGVAITTNIGTRYKQKKEIPVSIYKEVIDIGYILGNQTEAKDKIISVHMSTLNEYLNVLKTDVRALLSQSNDRSFALEAYIDQLKYRYKVGIENFQTLSMQKTELLQVYNETNQKITELKNKMGDDFGNFNNKETLNNIDSYLKLKQESLNAFTYITFINKFLHYYTILSDYNKKLLDTLINNKEVIIKNTQVVIPDSGGEILKDLQILYGEKEWKESMK